jgi:hypothetical protein
VRRSSQKKSERKKRTLSHSTALKGTTSRARTHARPTNRIHYSTSPWSHSFILTLSSEKEIQGKEKNSETALKSNTKTHGTAVVSLFCRSAGLFRVLFQKKQKSNRTRLTNKPWRPASQGRLHGLQSCHCNYHENLSENKTKTQEHYVCGEAVQT